MNVEKCGIGMINLQEALVTATLEKRQRKRPAWMNEEEVYQVPTRKKPNESGYCTLMINHSLDNMLHVKIQWACSTNHHFEVSRYLILINYSTHGRCHKEAAQDGYCVRF